MPAVPMIRPLGKRVMEMMYGPRGYFGNRKFNERIYLARNLTRIEGRLAVQLVGCVCDFSSLRLSLCFAPYAVKLSLCNAALNL